MVGKSTASCLDPGFKSESRPAVQTRCPYFSCSYSTAPSKCPDSDLSEATTAPSAHFSGHRSLVQLVPLTAPFNETCNTVDKVFGLPVLNVT